MRHSLFCSLLFVLIGVMLAGCGGLQKQMALSPEEMEKVIEIKASNFSFEPNNIKAYAGDTLVFRIENLADGEHNFTMEGPDGETITDVDLPAKEATDARVMLTTAGIYTFHCGKPFHKSLGMKGQVVAVERP